MSDLTLIIPAKNEKESLPRVLDELKKFNVKKNIILEASERKHTGGQRIHLFCEDSSKVLLTSSSQLKSIGREPFIFQLAINIKS